MSGLVLAQSESLSVESMVSVLGVLAAEQVEQSAPHWDSNLSGKSLATGFLGACRAL